MVFLKSNLFLDSRVNRVYKVSRQSRAQEVPMVKKTGFILYLHYQQMYKGLVKGSNLAVYLVVSGLIDRCFSLRDSLIKGWIANPSTYPEKLKDKAVFLWNSRKQVSRTRHLVAYLIWDGRRVLVCWGWLGVGLAEDSPALLKPAA